MKDTNEPSKVYVECIKPEIDLELFISEKRTGYSRPGPTFYENYYTGQMKDAIFGVDIEAHLTSADRKIPEIIELCLTRIEKSGIAEEGIYRLSGRQSKVQQLKALFDKNKAAVNLYDNDVHNNDVASLVKLYIRELPRPLCTYMHYESFIAVAKIEDAGERVQKLAELIQRLPEVNRATLSYLLKHLKKAKLLTCSPLFPCICFKSSHSFCSHCCLSGVRKRGDQQNGDDQPGHRVCAWDAALGE